jgi:hypothetical protein
MAIALYKSPSPIHLLSILLGWMMAGHFELVLRILYSAWIFPALCNTIRQQDGSGRPANTNTTSVGIVPSIETVTVDWIL